MNYDAYDNARADVTTVRAGRHTEGRVTVTGPLQHRCPFTEEDDHGTITLSWSVMTASGDDGDEQMTLELHDLAAWLRRFAPMVISHEDLTCQIGVQLAHEHGFEDATVLTTWNTAGLDVTVAWPPPA